MALLMPSSANAAGLGRLTLLSTLGQPLNAEIELTSVQKGETITARLASQDTYQTANVQFNAALAGTRVTVEKRPNGQVYLKATTPRAVSEPFVELLIEINSENGRVMRQYTALLDPPGYGSAAGELPPPLASAPTTRAPVQAAPESTPSSSAAAAAAPGAPTRAPAPQGSGAKQYGPIKRGETLGRIARTVKPEGVSLEQALVGLYRQNPDAFIKKNMNLVRTGKILRVPETNEFAAVAHRTAQQEVRLQVADFNAYSSKLADRAGAAPEGGSVASGRIGTRTADSAAGEDSRATVRLSRGEQAGKGKGKAGTRERVRALEEEAIAREKALTEANERIAQLEKTIKDMQRLAELKSSGTAVATGADKGAKAPAASVAVAPPAVPPSKADPSPAKGAAPDATKGPAPDAAKATVPEPAMDAAKAPPPAPKAEPAQVAKKPPPPAPAPQMDFVDMLFSEPLYLAAGGAVLLLGGLGFVAARRRRSGGRELQSDDDGMVKIAPKLGGGAPGGGSKAAALAIPASRIDEKPVAAPARPAGASDVADNDLDFNVATRRGAVQPQPRPASPAARAAPTAAPEPKAPPPRPAEPPRAAEPPHAAEPPRVAAPPPRAAEPPRAPEPPRAAEPPRIVEPPRAVEAPRAPESSRATDVLRAAQAKAAEPLMPDFGMDTPAPTPAAPKPVVDTNTIDFNLEPLPLVGTPLDAVNRVSTEPPTPMDFKLDLNNLDLEPAEKRSSGSPAHDDHWYDVQQKFDLAKAYEEMGDKEGARDILQEVLKEGDVEQQAQAKKLLGSLS